MGRAAANRLRATLATHARRLAHLDRISALAEAGGRADVERRVARLRELEKTRHERQLAAITDRTR